MVYLGYSTTQVFYGQQLHFSMTRWQGSDGDHESGKCKEFLRHLSPALVLVRGYTPNPSQSGDDDAKDLSRVLRLPGTLNYKMRLTYRMIQ
jgi:hypothetical protein